MWDSSHTPVCSVKWVFIGSSVTLKHADIVKGMVESNFIDFDKPAVISGGVATATNDRTVRSVREFCTTWSRAVKTICLYPSSNPLPDEFRGKFFDALTLLLEDHGQFILQISDTALTTSGQIVYESTPGEENLAYMFFKDGIREVGFEIGVSRLESDRFLQIGADALAAIGAKIDVANRLWEASFPHIKHYTVDRVIEGAYIEAAGDQELAATHEQFTAATVPDRPFTGKAAVAVERQSPYSGTQRERHLHVMQVFGDVTALTISEKSEIALLCRPESNEAAESLGLEILMEIIRSTDGGRMLDDGIAVVESQFAHAVAANRWDLVRKILIEVRGLLADVSERVAQRINGSILKMADKRHFDQLAVYLNANPQTNLDPIRDVLSLLGTAAITPTTGMLGTVEHRPARMMICDFLIANGRETVDLIGGFIYDKRWFVSRNVAMILGEIGNERGVTFLKKSAAHTDSRVRLETLRASKRILGEEAEKILRGFLNDPDVDLRKRALRALGQRNSTAVVGDLKAQIDPETLPDRDASEVKELLLTYSRLGGAQAAHDLIDLARRSPFFKKSRWQPVRLSAIRALGASTDPAARGELEVLSKDRATDVAEAARYALALRHRMAGSAESPESEDDE